MINHWSLGLSWLKSIHLIRSIYQIFTFSLSIKHISFLHGTTDISPINRCGHLREFSNSNSSPTSFHRVDIQSSSSSLLETSPNSISLDLHWWSDSSLFPRWHLSLYLCRQSLTSRMFHLWWSSWSLRTLSRRGSLFERKFSSREWFPLPLFRVLFWRSMSTQYQVFSLHSWSTLLFGSSLWSAIHNDFSSHLFFSFAFLLSPSE